MKKIRINKRNKDNTITLINIIFLLLIFILIAGSFVKKVEGKNELVEISNIQTKNYSDLFFLLPNGDLKYNEILVTNINSLTSKYRGKEIRIVPDKNSSAKRLIEISYNLKKIGVAKIFIVTKNTLK